MPEHREQTLVVCDRELLDADHVVLTFQGAMIAEIAQPGQFVNLSCGHFLRRPFGIMSVDRAAGLFQVGIRRQGVGTRELAELSIGSLVSALGPLGHGFDLSRKQQVITVGGGTGVFPLLFVHQVCQEMGIAHLAVCGYRSSNDAILKSHFQMMAESCIFASDTGGLDLDGNATDALAEVLSIMDESERANTIVMACGPNLMLKGVAAICFKEGVACEVSLEERMACGVGVCLCCAVSTVQDGEPRNERCCVEGPVFQAEDVRWA